MRVGSALFLICVIVCLALNAGSELTIVCSLVADLANARVLGTDIFLRACAGLLIVKFENVVYVFANVFFVVLTSLRHGGDDIAA